MIVSIWTRVKPPQPRTSSRTKGKNISYRGMCNSAEIVDEPSFDCLPAAFSSSNFGRTYDAPKSLKSALQMYDGHDWLEACKEEMDSLAKTKVWTLSERPLNKKVIRGMWLFTSKVKLDGKLKHKARYVAMGNTQVAAEDYSDMFAPTDKPSSL